MMTDITTSLSSINCKRCHHRRRPIRRRHRQVSNAKGACPMFTFTAIIFISVISIAIHSSPVTCSDHNTNREKSFWFRRRRRRSQHSSPSHHPDIHHGGSTPIMTKNDAASTIASSSSPQSVTASTSTSTTSNKPLIDESSFELTSTETDHDESLIFEGTFQCQSDQIVTLPKGTTSQDLLRFFQNHTNRDVLIKGGGNPVDSIPSTLQIYDEWTKRSKIVHSTPPSSSLSLRRAEETRTPRPTKRRPILASLGRHLIHTDSAHTYSSLSSSTLPNDGNNNDQEEEVLAIHSDATICPGLAIDAVSYTGCKLSVNPTTLIPQYEFTLLHDTYKAKGQRPMVWIFDRVTGGDSNNRKIGTKNNKKKGKQRTTSTTTQSQQSEEALTGAALIGNSNAAIGDHGGTRTTYALSRITLSPIPKQQTQQSYGKTNTNASTFHHRGGGWWGNTNSGGGSSISSPFSSSAAAALVDTTTCRVSYYGHVKVSCKLPKSFLGFLPVPKHKVEDIVSKAIVKQLEQEGTRSVQQFADKLIQWSSSSSSSD